jgi:5-formyltetrahydrofolate cyclo-ligase
VLRARLSAAIAAHLAEYLVARPQLKRVALYAACGSEVDLSSLVSLSQLQGRVWLYPRVRGPGQAMVFVRAWPDTPWQTVQMGLREPIGPAVSAAEVDMVAVPGLAFDDKGHRLGYGGGYYDRTLAAMSAQTLGIAFAVQRAFALPHDRHDVRLSGLVDEAGVWPVDSSA